MLISEMSISCRDNLKSYLDQLYPYLDLDSSGDLDMVTAELWHYWETPHDTVEDLIAALTADRPEGAASLGITLE